MTLSELIYEIRSHLSDPYGQILSDVTITKAINLAYKRICQDTYVSEQFVAFNVPANIKLFRLPDWVAVVRDAYWEQAADGTVTPMYPISRYQVTTVRPDWHVHAGTGTPLYYFSLGLNTFGLIPIPSSEGLFRAYVVVVPSTDPAAPLPELQNPTDIPQIPEQFHVGLIYGALAHLYLRPLHPQHLELMEYWQVKYRQVVQEIRRYLETFDDRSLRMDSMMEVMQQLPIPEYKIIVP